MMMFLTSCDVCVLHRIVSKRYLLINSFEIKQKQKNRAQVSLRIAHSDCAPFVLHTVCVIV